MTPEAEKSDNHKVLYLRDFRADFELPHCRYFVISKKSIRESFVSLDHLVDRSNYFFVSPHSNLTEKNAISGIGLVCRLPIPQASSSSEIVNHLYELEASSDRLHKFWQKNILVIGYKGYKGNLPKDHTTIKNFVKPGKCIFEVHCAIASVEQKVSMDQLKLDQFDYVVCNWGNGQNWCLLKQPYLTEVLRQCQTKVNFDVLRDKVETLEVGRGGVNLFKHSAADQERAKMARKKKLRVNACDRIRRFCRCTICWGDTSYNDNMHRSGPEKLLTRNMSVKELLKILGQDSPQNCGILEDLSRLSVAAFDIESMTVALDHLKPAENLPQADLDQSLRGQHNLATQKPIMLAHRDGLMDCQEPCPVFTLGGDDESDIYQLIRDYWKFVRQRQKSCSEKKNLLAQPLFELLSEYENAYIELAKNWTDPFCEGGKKKLSADEIVSGWTCSLPGRLKRQLQVLTARYEIFSFYGAGYDQVLLTNYLIPYLFEKRLNPSIEKNGNKVNVIKVKKCHVAFRDVVKLLSPGTSLKQFGQLFNLEQAKAHFPFAILTGVDSLKVPQLPSRLEDWHSDLSSSKQPLTLKDVEEAHRLFRMSNCQNVGDYLQTYLRLDVDILYKATQGWRATIAKEIGVDFVQDAKFTISSVSNFAGDLCTSKNLQIGQFFPNSSAVYRLLRKGMRG